MSATVAPTPAPEPTATATAAPPIDAGPGGWAHLPSLDGLRALAVIGVLLFHAGHLRGGFLGVDLFFALSGFLITSLLLRDARSAGGIGLVAFWGRRFRRLLPAVLVLITACALWAWIWGSAADLDGVKSDGPWALVYLANWHLIAESGGYWASFAQPSMFDHLWSLAIEEQFYVLWPFVVLAVFSRTRRPERSIVWLCIVGIAASLTVMVLLAGGGDPTRVYMGTDTRAASILVGALAATATVRAGAVRVVGRLGRRIDVLLAVLVIGIGWSWFVVDGASSEVLYRGGMLVHSTACALVVLLLATSSGSRVGRGLSWRPLTVIGLLSYGLYLWHWPVYVVLDEARTGREGWDLTVIRIAVAALLATGSYLLVESPIRFRATWARGRSGAIAFAGSMGAVALLLALLPAPEREIATFDADELVASVTATTPPPVATTPSTTPATTPGTVGPSVTATTTTQPATTTTLPPRQLVVDRALWTGDSVAYDLAPAVVGALEAGGWTMSNKAFPGERLIASDGTPSGIEAIREEITTRPVDAVIHQLSVWDANQGVDAQTRALTDLWGVVRAEGAALVLVAPPVMPDDESNEGMARMQAIARDLGRFAGGELVVLDPGEVWGDEVVIDLDGDGTPERKRDGIHLCPSGAARFALWLAAELSEVATLEPADPSTWISGSWTQDERYDMPVGACAPLP